MRSRFEVINGSLGGGSSAEYTSARPLGEALFEILKFAALAERQGKKLTPDIIAQQKTLTTLLGARHYGHTPPDSGVSFE